MDDQRAFIVQGLLKAAEMDDVDIQEIALQAISEVPFVGYQHIDCMIQNVGSLTMTLLSTDRYTAIRQAFFFWSNLAKEEFRQQQFGRSQNLVS